MKMCSQFVAGLLLGLYAMTSSANYQPLPESCDGLPKVSVGSISGTCLGLVADAGSGVPFIKPRKALEIPHQNRILVTDMGGWGANRGILWLLEFGEGGYGNLLSANKIATGLNLPHDIKAGPDGYLYLGEADRITRFRLDGNRISERKTAVEGLPFAAGKHLHPLTSFVFLPNGDLLVNAGSKTDDCGLGKGATRCDEINSTGLRLYPYDRELQSWNTDYELYASGLRNSVALTLHPSGTILQGENSTDLKNADEPYEELNVIRRGGFYGWPYCANRKLDTGYIPNGCEREDYIEPYSLMPPHTAPLDLLYYTAELLPDLKDKLLVSWHGYRVVGNRLVAYPTSSDGLPLLAKQVTYNRDPIPPAREFTRHHFEPEGGSTADAQHTEIIDRWNKVDGVRPEGAPVGLLQLRDGSLLIVDDKNQALLRLSRGTAYVDSSPQHRDTPIDGFEFTGEARHLLLDNCSGCHRELQSSPGALLNPKDGWLRNGKDMTLLEKKLTGGSGFMPPTGRLANSEIETILGSLKNTK